MDDVQVVRAFVRAIELYRDEITQRFHIGNNDAIALGQLDSAGGRLTARDLTERMRMSSGTMTAILDRLESGGFAAREPNPLDRRSVIVSLQPKGRLMLDSGRREMQSVIDRALPESLRPVILRGLRDLTIEMNAPRSRAAAIPRVDDAPAAATEVAS